MATKKYNAKKNTVTETVPESFVFFLKWVMRVMVSVYTVLILVVLPLYFEQGYTHIGTDKSTFFRKSAIAMSRMIVPTLLLLLVFWLLNMWNNRRLGREWKPQMKLYLPDYFALGYGVSVVISYLCSNYKDTALWGTKGWYMGMLPHLTLVALYFLVSRFQLGAKWMLYVTMAVTTGIFILGYLNRFDVWPLPMENSGLDMYISTVGNINWYCGYMVSVLFWGVGLLWLEQGEKRWYTVVLSVYTCIGFGALVTQGSDSGLFALAFVFVAMFVMSAKSSDPKKMKRFWLIVGLFALACIITLMVRLLFPKSMNFSSGLGDLFTYTACPFVLVAFAAAGWWLVGKKPALRLWKVAAKGLCITVPIIIFVFAGMVAVNTAKPGSLGPLSEKAVFTFDNKWGSARGATWKLGVMCFGEQDVLHTLVGVGPDCMVDYLYKGRSAELGEVLKEAFPNRRLTNAHNELITILVNLGICGLVAFAGLLFSLLKRLLQVFEQNKYAAACGLCILAYIANNIWSFQQSLSVATIFVVMGLGMHLWCLGENRGKIDN